MKIASFSLNFNFCRFVFLTSRISKKRKSNVLFLLPVSFLGFIHSAFALGYEAGINKCSIDGNLVPPGALVTVVQKGLQYLEMEANLSNVSTINFMFLLILYVCIYLFKNYAGLQSEILLF